MLKTHELKMNWLKKFSVNTLNYMWWNLKNYYVNALILKDCEAGCQHTQIKIDVSLICGEYSVNTLMTNASLLIYMRLYSLCV